MTLSDPRLLHKLKAIRRRFLAPPTRRFDFANVPKRYQQIASLIYETAPVWGSHQTITFPDGYKLHGGRDETRIDHFDLPKSMIGLSVLDIGCNIGAIAMECKKRWADRVVGLDHAPKLINCAKELAKIFNLEIEYLHHDLKKDKLSEPFDYVFFLNVFHHLDERQRLKTLRELDRITKSTLFFEAPVENDIIAEEGKCLAEEDYHGYLKGFTKFVNIETVAITDFGRPLIRCTR